MTNGGNELTRVNWGEVFAFTRVFKSGALARNISTLALGLAVIFLICATGWVLDNAASLTGQAVLDGKLMSLTAAPPPAAPEGGEDPGAAAGESAPVIGTVSFSEIEDYARLSPAVFAARKQRYLDARPGAAAVLRAAMARERHSFASFGAALAGTDARGRDLFDAFADAADARMKEDKDWKAPDLKELGKEAEDDLSAAVQEAKRDARKSIEDIERLIGKARADAEKSISDSALSKKSKSEAMEHLAEDYKTALRQLTLFRMEFDEAKTSIQGNKIFDTLITYEGAHLKRAVGALLSGNISNGLVAHLAGEPQGGADEGKPGFIVEMLLVVAGVKWLFVEHWFFGSVFVLAALVIWALFGGAMHRVAALQAGRDEKISLFEAIRFARSRFFSFLFAPLMPLAFVAAFGVLLMGGGLLMNIPWVGPFIVGLLFFFALLLGLAVAFLLIGLFGGFGLMYPTIAVEGSDCFDAMSRSFTYVFSRPWRAALYGVAALLHGAVCYVFVRFFAFLTLISTHWFVKGAVWTGGQSLPTGATANPDTMDVLWTAPTFGNLHTWNWQAMSAAQGFGALLIMAWVYLIIGLVAAFALSYLAGGMTTIYYLLRREVDATEFDEVYVGEEDEDIIPPGEPAPAEETAPEDAPAPEAAAEQTPPEQPPAEEAPADDAEQDDAEAEDAEAEDAEDAEDADADADEQDKKDED